MDPLSIVAGVVGTVGVALHLSRRLFEEVDGIVNGPAELVAMRRDTRDFFEILANLEPMLREKEVKEDKDIFDVVQRLNQPLDNCMATLKNLEILIQKSVRPTGELKKSKWRSFAATFREKELRTLAEQLASGKLTLGLALTTINTIRSARIQKGTNDISNQITELRADLKNQDHDKVQLASVRGRKGSDSRTDFGFALERFLENVSVMDQPLSPSSFHSDVFESSVVVEGTVDSPPNAMSDETFVESFKYPAEMLVDKVNDTVAGNSANEEKVPDGKRRHRIVNRVEFRPVNTSVYDARLALPSTYQDISSIPTIIVAIDGIDEDTTDLNIKARRGNLDAVISLMNGSTTFLADSRGNTPVHEASANGQVEVLKFLLSLKPDLEARDDRGLTALHKAASVVSSQSIEIVNLLIGNGARLDPIDYFGATPLHHAAWQGSEEAARILLQYGAQVNIKDNFDWVPLHFAAYQGNKCTADRLLDRAYGGRVDAVGPDATTALIWAAEKGHADVVKLLLDSGATVDHSDCMGSTALHHAAANGFADVIEVLAQNGANIEFKNNYSACPLHVAAQFAQTNATETLLSSGADPNVAGTNGWPALHQAAGRGHTNILNVLLKGNADSEERGQFTKTAIIWAGEIGQTGSARALLAHGANPNAQDAFGETSLHYASANGQTEIVRVLLSQGADLRIRNGRSMQPLHNAALAFGGVLQTSIILLDHKADPNAKDGEGNTPLHYVARSGNDRLVRLLLDHLATPWIQNFKKKTPVNLAEDNGHVEVAKVLQNSSGILSV